MFDYVKFRTACPSCGQPLEGFQTKDTGCSMDTVDIDHVFNFYTNCICGAWVEYSREPKYSDVRSQIPGPYEAAKLGFKLITVNDK